MSLNVFKSYRLKLEIDLDLEIDLGLDPMTFIYEHDLDILKMHLYTKNEVRSSTPSKVRTQNDGHTDTQNHRHTDRQTHATENNTFLF